ncbi:MAG: tyrosine-type recombinase/integrase, partial [Desulfurococcales archaeon]|nr:tyrosine-type recombinase/integrase [Desulfurococcales archaeon]
MARRLELPPPPSGAAAMRLGEAVDAFLAALEAAGASPSTLRAYRAALESFASHVGHDAPVSSLGAQHYTEWLRALRSRGPRRPRTSDARAREATIHYYSVYVRRFLSWLGVARGLPAVSRGRRGYSRALSWDEVNRLLSASKDLTDALIVALLAESGLRARELLGLTWGDLDLQAGLARVRGKYGKERTVPLGPTARILLAEALRARRPSPSDRVVPMSYQALYKRLKTLAARAGVDPARVRPHVLRHTFATEALRRGMSLPALQRILGHSDIKVTQLYLHLVWEDVKSEYQRVFSQPQPQAAWAPQPWQAPPQP